MVWSLENTPAHVLPAVREIINEVKKVIVGKDEVIIKAILAIIAGGHILLEDMPGVGKTTLAVAFSRAMSLECRRMQFTADVMPSDVTGFTAMNRSTGAFEYHSGAAVCNLFLADEINRTSSRTQSALLEAMEEHAVTVDGVTHRLPEPYIVIATQNPVGSAGTQLLPESQLDRFMIRLSIGYPDPASEAQILKNKRSAAEISDIRPVITAAELLSIQKMTADVYADDRVYRYIADIAAATRSSSEIELGISTRGAIAISAMAKATAVLKGRDYVIPDDVDYILPSTAAHRLVLSSHSKNISDAEAALKNAVSSVRVPKL
ncbi:MAG: MoxR family ATPase [Oscillospiraceae bacterium]|nr:MoxR family ATPase [Oscillospiraceae bacterium]